MDEKFRVSFYPADSSKIREFSFSRKLGLSLAVLLVPISLGGFWLTCSGAIREDDHTGRIRDKLVSENTTLKGRSSDLEREMAQVHKHLDELEAEKINLSLLSGLEHLQDQGMEKQNTLFSFFRSFSSPQINDIEALRQAQDVSSYFDSILAILEENPNQSAAIPTGLPIQNDALMIRGYGFFPDPFTGRKARHEGLDFSHAPGSPIFATGGGRVVLARSDAIWGNCLQVEHAPGIHTFYAHLDEIKVRQGQIVTRGEQIATLGSTGISSGTHLHYELVVNGEKVDPLDFMLAPLHFALEPDENQERIYGIRP